MLPDIKTPTENCFSISASPAIEFSKVFLIFIGTLKSSPITFLQECLCFPEFTLHVNTTSMTLITISVTLVLFPGQKQLLHETFTDFKKLLCAFTDLFRTILLLMSLRSTVRCPCVRLEDYFSTVIPQDVVVVSAYFLWELQLDLCNSLLFQYNLKKLVENL